MNNLNNRRYTLSTSLLASLLTAFMACQSVANDKEPEILSSLQNRAASAIASRSSNTAIVNQDGTHNQARIKQAVVGSGYGNTAYINQSGSDNYADIAQKGSQNHGEITQQGNSHEASISQSGNGLNASLRQSGSGGSQVRLYQNPAHGVSWSSTGNTTSVEVRAAQ
ncbi:hypothetical protein [Halomonas sp. WWR20]